MSATLIQNPFNLLNDLNGIGLNGGKVYIGEENEDPQTNPVPVFWDVELTDPATQPLDVLGGYIMHLGSPAIPYTATRYSIRVRDRLGSQVFYEPSSAGIVVDDAMKVDGSNVQMTDEQKTYFRNYIGVDGSGLIYGDGAPTDDIGADGGSYVNQATGVMYGPKVEGTWSGAGTYTFASHTAPSIPLPAGTVGFYYFKNQNAGGYIPNEVGKSSLTTVPGILPVPSGHFDDATLGFGGSGSVVSQGGSSANVTLQATGSGGIFNLATSGSWPAATFSIVIDCQRNAGSDQPFKAGFSTSGTPVTVTAVAARTRLKATVTITAGANQPRITAVDGATAADITIFSIQIYPGSADLEPSGTVSNGNLYYQPYPYSGLPVLNSKSVDCSANNCGGWIKFPSSVDLSQCTFIALFKNNRNSAFGGMLTWGGNYTKFTVGERSTSSAGTIDSYMAGTFYTTAAPARNASLDAGWRLSTSSVDGGGHSKLFTNYSQFGNGTSATAFGVNTDVYQFNCTNEYTSSLSSGYEYYAVAIVSTSLTVTQIYQVQQQMVASAIADGLTFPTLARSIFSMGDSIQHAWGDYMVSASASFTAPTILFPSANDGNTLETGGFAYVSSIQQFPVNKQSGQLFYTLVCLGTNGMSAGYVSPHGNGTGLSAWVADYKLLSVTLQNAGFRPVVATLLPQSEATNPTWNTNRNIVNPQIRQLVTDGFAYDCFDLAADSVMGPDAAGSNTALYYDGKHPTETATNTYIVPLAVTFWNSVP